jgi:predicted transcriptional regulator
MAYARVSLTLPKALLAAADRRAKELDRSRSWVTAQALRQWLVPGQPLADAGSWLVRETAAPYETEEVANSRRRHLAAELKLSPAERLRRAVELGRLARARQPRGPRAQIIGFDSYEDFYEWKKGRRAGA